MVSPPQVILEQLYFACGMFEPCIFRHHSRPVFILCSVHDCILVGKLEHIAWTKEKLKNSFSIKEAPLSDFLGLDIQRLDSATLQLDAATYVYKVLIELGITDQDKCDPPIPTSLELFLNDGTKSKSEDYQKFLGKLLWITMVSPEIGLATHLVVFSCSGCIKS